MLFRGLEGWKVMTLTNWKVEQERTALKIWKLVVKRDWLIWEKARIEDQEFERLPENWQSLAHPGGHRGRGTPQAWSFCKKKNGAPPPKSASGYATAGN